MTGIQLPENAITQITGNASEVAVSAFPIAALIAGVLLGVGIILFLVGGFTWGTDDDDNDDDNDF
jgi:hypothetical protein